MADEDPPGELLLVRHGQTEWSRAGRHTGTTDLPLLAEGEEQARRLAPVLAARRAPVLALVSPLLRARRTAELAGVTDAEVVPELAERRYGGAEGRTLADLRSEHPGLDPWRDALPPGEDGAAAETVEQLAERVGVVVDRARPLLEQGDVLCIAHGHSLRALAARWLGLPPSGGELFSLDPAALSTLGVHHDVPVLRTWNVPAPA